MKADKNNTTLEKVTRYNLRENLDARDELRRVLAKIVTRRVTGKIEIDLTEGTPAEMFSREVVKAE
jgi:hypothetical protein